MLKILSISYKSVQSLLFKHYTMILNTTKFMFYYTMILNISYNLMLIKLFYYTSKNVEKNAKYLPRAQRAANTSHFFQHFLTFDVELSKKVTHFCVRRFKHVSSDNHFLRVKRQNDIEKFDFF